MLLNFFDNLSRAYSKSPNGPLPQNIYNLDETALTTVHNPPNIIGQKGLKQIGQVTSGERGVLVTACCFVNATGNSVAPFLIFPRVHFKNRMITGAPPGTAGGAEKTGWVNSEAFMDILKHLHRFVKSTPEWPIFLIIDNHQSHISISSLEFCKSNGIMLLSLPPHTSEKTSAIEQGYTNPSKVTLTLHATTGWSTEICPLNRNIFSEEDFLSSSVTDRPLENVLPLEELPQLPTQRSPALSTSRQSPIHRTPEHSPRHSPPPDSLEFSVTTHQSLTVKPTTSTLRFITPVGVRPYPKASARKEILSKRIKVDTSESEEESMSIADSDASVGAFSVLDKIGIREYVLIREGRTKEHDVMSVGKILTKNKLEISVQYNRPLLPSFKFIETQEEYLFETSKVLAKLPKPKPSGGTARRSEMLVFPIDLQSYYNELK
ncbi:hypothetical protein NQ314_017020 [Rhamnusium bicolor]|uniref:DDE-1 domain-containing protein n=1 Tax=Rhamnusium bicolor TaxID=1586634 RepID=A0AAV8WUF5_9CUCU|nr:hypothetical protein NQ314_017020 [Rhamnusium bicolor]